MSRPGNAVNRLVAQGPTFAPGSVWLVGAGPGDPGYLTVNALVGLTQADVILYDALIDRQTLDLARPDAEVIYSGKRAGLHSIDQDSICARLVSLAQSGRRVLRLKGGDPMVFGRGGEEMLMLAQAGIPFRIIPGVTAGLAALAVATIPATLRDVNRAVVLATGHEARDSSETDWAAMARLDQPIVLYMALRRLDSIASALMSGGMAPDVPVAIIASATMPEENILVIDLATAARDGDRQPIDPPAIIVIGEIVRMRAKLRALAPSLAEALA